MTREHIAAVFLTIFLILCLLLIPSGQEEIIPKDGREELLFDLTDRSLVRIRFAESGNPQLERLYSFWQDSDGSDAQRAYLEDQVRIVAGNLLVQTRVRDNSWHPGVARGEPQTRNRVRLTLYEKNRSGTWSQLAAVAIDEAAASPAEVDKLWRVLTSEKQKRRLDAPDALLPVPDPEFIDALRAQDYVKARAQVEQLRERHPNNLFLVVAAVDLSLLQGDYDSAESILEKYGDALQRGSHFFYPAAREYYLACIDEQKRPDALEKVPFFSLKGPDNPSMEQILEGLQQVDAEQVVKGPHESLLFRGWSESDVNFRTMSTVMPLLQVDVVFQLLSGRPEAALQRLLGPMHFNINMIESTSSITSLLGIAQASQITESLELVFLDGFISSDDMKKYWFDLDRLYIEHSRALKSFTPKSRPHSVYASADPLNQSDRNPESTFWKEQETRMKVSLARLGLLHSAAVLRQASLELGTAALPEQVQLLRGQLDNDPFPDFQRPLRWQKRPDQQGVMLLYSIGPDGSDQSAEMEYDPTNGTLSAGDIILRGSEVRRYPFPRDGALAATREGIMAQFPNGFPRDPFGALFGASLVITGEEPPSIVSSGPDHRSGDSSDGTVSSRWLPEQGWEVLPAYSPQVSYDPTNGLLSSGDIILLPARE